MAQRTTTTLFQEDESRIKEIGRYSAATAEYSVLIMGSFLQRGGNTIKKGAVVVASPFQKGGSILKKGAGHAAVPIKKLGGSAKKLFIPFSWSTKKISSVCSSGIPVHLDKETLVSIHDGLSRIEDRIASLEKKGIVFAQGMPNQSLPDPDDFKKKTSKEQNMLLRSILEDSKKIIENDS